MSSTADTIAPNLLSLSIPKVVDLSSGTVGLTASGLASDDISGVKEVLVWFDKDFTYSLGSSSSGLTNLLPLFGNSDSWSDGASSETWGIAGTNYSGIYNVTRVDVVDLQGNTRSYSPSELAAIGVNTSVDFINSTVDVTPPQLTSLTIPNVVDLSSGTAGLTASGLATDDISGVKEVLVWFDKDFTYSLGSSSSGLTNLLPLFGNSDSWSDGASSETWGIAGTNSSGIYNVTRVDVVDLQGNTRSYSPSELAAMGVNTSVWLVKSSSVLTSGNDSWVGTVDVDWIVGGDGDDSLNGLDGNDFLDGGRGNDVLDGGAGSDKLVGGLGNDTYHVDSGNDVVIEAANGGIDTVISSVSRTLGNHQENLILSGTAAINGGGNSLANTLTGNSAANVLNGGLGADTMIGGMGNDTYHVDSGNDMVIEAANGGIDTVISSVSRTLGNHQENLILSGTSAINGGGNSLANTLTGNSAANVLNGGSGNDILSGGAGNDRLVGGAGKDVLTGGEGNDIFVFTAVSETGLTSSFWDVITDFKRGTDKIDLATLDANTATAANEAFNAIIGNTTTFTAAGQLKVANGVLYGNTDADSTPEFAIQLTGITSLAASDFVL